MFGRKKQQDGAGVNPPGGRLKPGRDEGRRVLMAFLAEELSGAPIPGSGAPSAPPPLAAGVPQAGTGSENPFVFHMTNLIGPEYAQPRQRNNAPPNITVPVPGVGPVSAARLQQVSARVSAVMMELSGGTNMSKGASPAEVEAALGRLESMHQQGRVTDEQYSALKAAMESMLAKK